MATYPTNGLTLDQANTIIAAARAKGRELGLMPLTVVVLDAGGQVKASQREDGSSRLRPEIALGKAYGALALGLGGRELARRAARPLRLAGGLAGAGRLLVHAAILACLRPPTQRRG